MLAEKGLQPCQYVKTIRLLDNISIFIEKPEEGDQMKINVIKITIICSGEPRVLCCEQGGHFKRVTDI